MPAAIHLHPTAPLAERVLLPGDPGRALRLGQQLLAAPKMFNHNRGLWGYTGTASDGAPLTIQSTGMGGPSAAIVISELADLGAKRLLRIGTCGALDPTLALGDLLIATEAIAADGTSQALGANGRVSGDPNLTAALATAANGAAHQGPIVTTDLFYDPRPNQEEQWAAAGAQAVEMETATLFALATNRGLTAASLLLVTDRLTEPDRRRITDDELHKGEERLGAVAAHALTRN
jgi:DeoD family purine-nucleoside phosphorylase